MKISGNRLNGSMDKLEVIADHREGRSGVIESLGRFSDVALRVETLALGDYLWQAGSARFLFERKTMVDLAGSIKDGRLLSQGCRLATEAMAGGFRPAIILEGRSSDLANSGIRREPVQGVLVRLTMFLGIPLLRSLDADETARVMLYTGRQAARWGEPSRAARHFQGRRPTSKQRAQLDILQGIPGVGPGRAEALLRRFGSVEGVLTASPETLAEVDGIGSGVAAAIRWAVGERAAVYWGMGHRDDAETVVRDGVVSGLGYTGDQAG
jgi:ERCC4-type nuclease